MAVILFVEAVVLRRPILYIAGPDVKPQGFFLG
jgi:hypothetical protein